MLRPKIGLDWDDVTAPFNSIAIAMANEKYHIDPPLRLEEIDTWENRGRTGIIREFYEDEELYARQQVPEKNKKAVYRLMEIADVYFITAVAPAFMGIRAKQILTAFPEFPPENIILCNAKNLVQFGQADHPCLADAHDGNKKSIGSGTGRTVRFRKRRIDQKIMSGGSLCQSENLLHQEKQQASLSDKRTVCTAGFL